MQMKGNANMFSRISLLALFSVLSLVAGTAQAQDVPRVAICNPGKVFDGLTERKAIQDQLVAKRNELQAQAKQKQDAIDQLKVTRDGYDPKSAKYEEANQRLLEMAIQFDSWAKIQEQSLAGLEKTKVNGLYDKITSAVKALAEEKKIDLVIAAQDPQIDINKVTADQLRAVLMTRNIMYSNDKKDNVDITDAVIAKMNKEYK
jgi:Skp family chaperone for outer membrane proteins